MEELFFRVSPIFWEGKIPLYEVSLVGFLCILIFLLVWLLQRPRRATHVQESPKTWREPSFFTSDDREYALKTLAELKRMIEYFYIPQKTHAHTIHEIWTYLFDSNIMEIWRRLEESIYLSKPLTKEASEEINKKIRLFIEKSRKDFI